MKFSEKYGYTQARSVAQIESMDEPLRTALWNVTYMRYFRNPDTFTYAGGVNMMRVVWAGHLHRDLAQMPGNTWDAGSAAKQIINEGEWFEVYDLVQAIVQANPEDDLIETYNAVLDMHLAGYRIVDDEITQLTDKHEIEEVEAALAGSSRFDVARHSLKKALTLYSRHENPDYANSIKESISAVESVARQLTGKAALSSALDQLKHERPDIHQALIAGWKSLYGHASQTVRHGGEDVPIVTQDLARYYLVTCSAIVNYLIGLDV